MHLVLIGCEYSGTTRLSWAITEWTTSVMGSPCGFHDHWKIPHLNHSPHQSWEGVEAAFAAWAEGKGEDPTRMGFTEEEQELLLALTPRQKEMWQRYHMEYHLSGSFYSEDHHNVVGMHIDEAVYAGLYYGYGGRGEYADRGQYARRIEKEMLELAPNTVLVLCQASPEVIRSRMQENPHERGLLQDKDVELVVQRFEEEYEHSLMTKKFTVDTGNQTIEESLAEFVEKYDEFISEANRLRMLVHRAKQKGEWL